jgi:Fe-S cluster assembly protein SufD
MSLMQHYQLAHEQLLDRDEPHWLKEYRAFAFNSFTKQGIPSTQRETWKYTPLRLWVKNNFYHSPKTSKITQIHELQLFSMLDARCHEIVLVDGVYQAKLSKHKSPLMMIMDYAQAIQTHADLIQPHLGQAVNVEDYPFASLCDGLAQKGIVIIIPDNTVIEEPIHILYVCSKNSENCVNHLRNLFIIGKNSKVEIIEHYVDLHDVVYFNNIVTEIIVQENAYLSHYKLEQEGNNSFHIGSVHVKQMQGSTFNSDAVTLSGHFSRHDINTHLSGAQASCQLNGLYFTHTTQHVDYHTLIRHEAPHCTSASLYKGILADRSVSVFNGKVIVSPGAQKTKSEQGNHNLLLSPHCEVNSKPELEIYTDDVKCAHGATTGQLDAQALFFLQSRGIANSKARRMLIRAFANEVFNKMQSETVRSYCQRYLEMAAYE